MARKPTKKEEAAAGKELARFFFQALEERWAVTNLLLRTVIRHAALASDNPQRFVAAIFDDASALVDAASKSIANGPNAAFTCL